MKKKPHECIFCVSPLVQPFKWDPLDKDFYKITFRCPECESTFKRVFTRVDADELGNNFGDAYVRLEEYDRARFAEEIELFVTALDHNAIWPEDFGPL